MIDRITSGARLDPPMPSSTISEMLFVLRISMREPHGAIDRGALLHRQRSASRATDLRRRRTRRSDRRSRCGRTTSCSRNQPDARANSQVEIARQAPRKVGCRHLCSRLHGLTLPPRSLDRDNKPESQKNRDKRRVDGGVQDVCLHQPPVMHDACDRRQVNRDDEAGSSCGRRAGESSPAVEVIASGTIADQTDETDGDVRPLVHVLPDRRGERARRAPCPDAVRKSRPANRSAIT